MSEQCDGMRSDDVVWTDRILALLIPGGKAKGKGYIQAHASVMSPVSPLDGNT